MERKSSVKRKTLETDIAVDLVLESARKSEITTGVPFLDHMLESMSKHGRFWLKLSCSGDREIDDHHSVEDIGISMGTALKQALGDKEGILRFGDAIIPMDDALTMIAVDLSGRPYFKYTGPVLDGSIGPYSEELTDEFLRAFATNAGMNLHVTVFCGQNKHHVHETIFKALGIALYKASSKDDFLQGGVLSTKGTIV
ncbi:MAG: imidazoleglycerol-phosphate dehydratase [Spirochaetes bacterium RBG_16_49_21]|nr:MAG: imidazoleglycerol-phosphate dehydratase [Spirochaetes bacterium RBG_16_49_21]